MLKHPLYDIPKCEVKLELTIAVLLIERIQEYIDFNELSNDFKISILKLVHNSVCKKLNEVKKDSVNLKFSFHESIVFSDFMMNEMNCHFSYRLELDQIVDKIRKQLI